MKNSNAQLGEALKRIRKSRGWSLSEVSRRTQLAISSLSKVENNQMSFTYDKLVRLSKGLEVDISELFTPASKATDRVTARRSISRKQDGLVVQSGPYLHAYLCMDVANKQFVPMLSEIKARSIDEFDSWIRHPGEEFAYVLEGAVEVHTEFYQPVVLTVGESIWLDSTMGHAYVAKEVPCRTLAVCTVAGPGVPPVESDDSPAVRNAPHSFADSADVRRSDDEK